MNKKESDNKIMKDGKKIIEVVNQFLITCTESINPFDYKDEPKDFVGLALVGPAFFAASIVDKIAGTMGLDRELVVQDFYERLKIILGS